MDKELRKQVIERMAREDLSITKLGEILNLSRSTISRLVNEGTISKRNRIKLQAYVDDAKSYLQTVEMVNVGQIRIEREVYDYIKRFADNESADLTVVIRKILRDAADNDYLWKSMTDHLLMTERAVGNVIQKILIPFIKTQDKVLDNIDSQAFWLEEMIGRFLLDNYLDPITQEKYQEVKSDITQAYMDRKYDRKND